MLKEFEERIQNAKNKQFKMLERFHIGDAVYPFWLKNFMVYGIVTDVDTVVRKVFCDFNGVCRQFCPEDLMHVNPEFINAATTKKRSASEKKEDETQGVYPPDTDNGIDAACKKCGGEVAVSYNEQDAMTDFVCTQCGHRIPEGKLSKESKKAMMEHQKRNFKASNKRLAQELARVAKMLLNKGEQ